jgi:hypothetical protein
MLPSTLVASLAHCSCSTQADVVLLCTGCPAAVLRQRQTRRSYKMRSTDVQLHWIKAQIAAAGP